MADLRSEEEMITEDSKRMVSEVDIFVENCSSLYNLILDQLHDDDSKDAHSCSTLEKMALELEEVGRRIVNERPSIEGGVQLRIHTISSAMEQLRLRRTTSDCDSIGSRSHPFAESRSWIHQVEERLKEHEKRFAGRANLTKLLADQQVLQLEIQSEGQALLSRLDNFINKGDSRGHLLVEAIRRRWHDVYLNSLALQYRIEESLTTCKEEFESDSDPDLVEPPSKRRRRASAAEDDDERETHYEEESEMDGRTTTATSGSADECEEGTRVARWDSVQADVGYSSGENSIHEQLNNLSNDADSVMRRSIAASPRKAFYETVPIEESDSEVIKPPFDKTANLTDSLIVNFESPQKNSPEYEEILALLNEEYDVMDGTRWKEMRGNSPKRRQSKDDQVEECKHSCDASSEDSSEWEGGQPIDIDVSLSLSMHSNFSTQSLKRPRGSRSTLRTSHLLLDGSEMEASFCSTRSEFPPCKSRSMRKKLRPRRFPRSMSDGEQLAVKAINTNGLITPCIRVSPPRTPLAPSTRLLQRLEAELTQSAEDSESQGELVEAPHYEWDEYHPPAKDERWWPNEKMAVARNADELLSVDEDFHSHLGDKNAIHHLIEESRANLAVVRSHLGSSEVDDAAMKTVCLIARTNIRHLQEAIKTHLPRNISDISELEDVMEEWKRISSPIPQLASKVERFAHSLRSLDGCSSPPLPGAISSKEQAKTALDTLENIQNKFQQERDELRSFLSSSCVRRELSGMEAEFESLSTGYDEAVDKISSLVFAVRKLNEDWNTWAEQQKAMRDLMHSLDERLRKGRIDTPSMTREIELCQERMNSLETMCNYLTSNLAALQEGEGLKHVPDFSSEMSLYAGALEQLKTRVNEALHVPPAPTVTTTTPSEGIRKRRIGTQTHAEQKNIVVPPRSLFQRILHTVRTSRSVQLLLLLSAVCAIAALFSSNILGTSFGPHLEYVRGPPPI